MADSELNFHRGDWTISASVAFWESVLNFLSQCGFASDFLFTPPPSKCILIPPDEAARLAQAGQVIQEAVMKDPMMAYSTIKFDMAKFAELVEFASEGGFVIRNAQ